MKKSKRMAAILSSILMLAMTAALPASAAAAQTTYQRGDVDLNGTIDRNDLVTLQAGLMWMRPLTDTQLMVADVNADGHVNLLDAAQLGAGAFEAADVTINYDENGKVVFDLGGQDGLNVVSDSWNAAVTNASNGSVMALSNWGMTNLAADSKLSVSPWTSQLTYSGDGFATVMNSNDWYSSTNTRYTDGTTLSMGLSNYGAIDLRNDALGKETAPFMRNTYDYFRYMNQNDAMFTQTGYGVDETVYLANAEITKRADGIDFVNHVSDDTVYSFMADDYVTIDGVTLSYADGEFTVEGIPEDEIEMLHTMTVDQYDEIAVVTNTPGARYVYGLMYDKSSASMAALVKVRLDKNAEATVIQYSKPADMATTINFYPQDWVLDYAMEHPDEMVTLFDTKYDADRLVFQTVHFPRKTKNTLAGALNMRYQITSGITYKQTAGSASIKSSYATTASTLAFTAGSDAFSFDNVENGYALGMNFGENASVYKQGTETFTFDGAYRYDADAAIGYTYADGSANFTVNEALAQHVPFRY
ncbi:MAG: dockerin type I repeat-containing protein [Oscillospiraceae bacterium]|nr:dockerin type I repeat-containing protein [Oscillospiraceae bacterium]